MSEKFSWSASGGRWIGIPVRIHLFLLLFIVAIFAIEMNFNTGGHRIGAGTAIVTVGILIASIVLHELAHLFAIANLGGHVNRIVLMPWGGNSDYNLPQEPRVRATIYAAGPFLNGVIFALGAALLVKSGHADLTSLTNTFRPYGFDFSDWQVSIAKIATWVNFQLMLVNLIPCFPFDGASLVRTFISSLNYALPKARVESAIMVMGHAVAFTMIGLALLIRNQNWGPIQFAWTALLFGGIILIFSARYSFEKQTSVSEEDWNKNPNPDPDYDSYFDDPAITDFELSSSQRENSVYSQWLVEKQEERLKMEIEREEIENQLADEILKKLHGVGLDSLSTEDRRLLDRVSARLRRRRQQGV